MKNAFKSLILVALAVQSLVSCQENVPKTASTESTSSGTPVVAQATPTAPTMETPSAGPAPATTTTTTTGATASTAPSAGTKTTPAAPAPVTPATTTTAKGGTAAPAAVLTPAPAPAVTPNATDAAAKTPPAAPTGKTTSIRWENPKMTHDWGSATIGDKITHIYKFTNTGTEPLVILDAKASCGCTVPEKPQAPIAPGKSSEIKVVFDSNGKPAGQTAKTVTVTANTDPGTMVLTLKGELKLGEDKK